MNIKVLCPCGTKFAFEVEPVNGRMPVNVNCPNCNQSALELANAQIRLQLEAAAAGAAATIAPANPQAEPAHRPRIHVSTHAASPAPAAKAPVPPSPPPSPPPASMPTTGMPQPSGAGSLRISKHAAPASSAAPPLAAPTAPAPTPAEAAAPEAGEHETQPLCSRHKTEPAVETCHVCGKPICPKCMEQFGYVCSVYCRQQANAKKIAVPVYANQTTVREGNSRIVVKRMIYATVAAAVVLAAAWTWYAWFARNPKVVYSLATPKVADPRTGELSRAEVYFQLIGPGQLLSVQNKQLVLTDLTGEPKQLWSARLQTEAEAAAIKAAQDNNERIIKATPKVRDPDTDRDITQYRGLDPLGYANDYAYFHPRVAATTNDIWVALSEKLIRFDRQTGSRKESGIKGKILSTTFGDNAIVVVAGEPGGSRTLNRISLPEGTLASEEIAAAVAAPVMPAKTTDKVAGVTAAKPPARGGGAAAALKLAAPKSSTPAAADTDADWDAFGGFGSEFIVAGPNVVQFQTKLLEHKLVTHEAMKPKTKSIVESGTLTAGQSMEASQEMLNDMQRKNTGGVEQEDVSRYQVTVKRRFAEGAPDWSGEVSGPPQFFPFKTVDVIAAGNTIQVLSKDNKKLWDAKLTYTVPGGHGFDGAGSPGLETKDALYLADQGILTRYDVNTGNVRWRMTSVGISKIQADARGKLYVTTTTAGPESIRYSQQINIHDKIHPVILKVDPETGKVLWRDESVGDDCRLSGKFVYATRISQSQAFLKLEEGPDTHFNLDLLSPGNGGVIWNYYQGNRHPVRTDIQDRWIMVHFDDGVEVLKFFSL